MTSTEKAESVVSRTSKKRRNRKKRARQWTYYVDNLKNTIDCMYELCRSEQSVAGCREAILYLERASNDFKSLIETINVEKEWADQEPQKRQSVAWEIRKSMSSPNPITISDKPYLPISSMIAEVVRNAGGANEIQSNSTSSPNQSLTYARITAAAAVAAVAVTEKNQNDEGWQIVGSRRRKSTSSTTVSEFEREMSIEKELTPTAPLNVYERLSSGSYPRGNGYSKHTNSSTSNDNNRLTCPRSAMDLPQTKASMAKMAYSRQLLWEKNQHALVEKMRARQKKEKTSTSSRTCGFTFADPLAVRKSVEEFNKQKINRKEKKAFQENISLKPETNRSLQSINEHENGEENDQSNILNEDIPADPIPSCSQKIMIKSSNSEPAPHKAKILEYVDVVGLENDVEWKEMTEEEESLALEENSLKLEIKQAEALSVDAELERQVEVEAARLEKEEKKIKKAEKKEKEKVLTTEFEKMYKVFQEIQTMAWSEMMQNTSHNVHEPGTPVEKHEKMNSPSRRRCQRDDDDFGKKHEMKLKRADELREKINEEKTAKLKELTKRVEEVREKKEVLKERKRQMLEERMQRASDNRDKNIMEVIRKAKDDDQRVMEVKFIATLQEDNKKYDLMMKDANIEEKQKQLADERAKKMEEKAAKKREQEAAAESRRMAAQTKIIKNRNLSEQKDAKLELKLNSSKDAETKVQDEASNFITEMYQMIRESDKKINESLNWPSLEKCLLKKCKYCDYVAKCEFECVSHLFEKKHLNYIGLKELVDKLENLNDYWIDFEGIEFEKAEKEKEKISTKKIEEERLNSLKILRNNQLTKEIPNQLLSPRNRTKHIRDFVMIFDKMINMKTEIDDQTQKNVERITNQFLGAIEDDEKNDIFINIEQFCAVGGVLKLFDSILEWNNRGMSLRLCVRLSHALCILLKNPRVSYSIMFKSELIRILDRIIYLIQKDAKNPQLSALLDILNAILNCAISRTSKNETVRKWKELYELDEKSNEIVENVARYMKNSLKKSEIRNALEINRGSGLITKIMSMTEKMNASIIGEEYQMEMIETLLEFTYEMRRSTIEKDEKIWKDLTNNVIRTCFKMGNGCKLVEKEYRAIMLAILMEDNISREIGTFLNDQKKKNEQNVLELIEMLGNISKWNNISAKKSILINFTSTNSSVSMILKNLPVKYFTMKKYAKNVLETISTILEDLPDSERNFVLGDISEGLLVKY